MFELLGIYWAGIDRLIYLPIFAVIIFFLIRNYRKNKLATEKLFHSNNQKIIFKNFSIKKQLLKTVLLSFSLILIFLALLQPQWGKKEFSIAQEGRDLLIVLDISRSMLAKDLKPNRLEFTKLKIRNLLSRLDFERVGLVLFSGSAFLQCPLTVDHNSFLMFLDQVDAETIASGTTAIDNAISKAIDVFEKCKGRKNKLVVLATDGEDFSLNLEKIKRKAKENNIKLFSLGIGTKDGAPIPILDAMGNQIGHEKDEKGQIAISKLNDEMLQKVCQDLDGNYFKTSYDDSDLDRLVNVIKSFEKERFEDKKLSFYQDQYPWLLGLAFLFLALDWIL